MPNATCGIVSDEATVSKSLEEEAREIARIQGQPAGKEEDGGPSDENGPLLVPRSARVVSGRRPPPCAHADRPFTVAKWTVGRVTPGAKSYENFRGAMESPNRVWDVLQGNEYFYP